MLARHPLTGKAIRILNCEAALWKDAATLVWLTAASDPSAKWNRYTVGTTSITDYEALKAAGTTPDICVAMDTVGVAEWLESGAWRALSVVAVPKATLMTIGLDRVRQMGITNMLCLDEVHHIYPHIGAAWDGTAADACVMLAAILRYARTGPIASQPPRICGTLKVLPTVEPPAPLVFLTQYYRPDKTARRKEIDACLARNLACPLIDRLVLLNETENIPLPESPKLTVKSIGNRLNFADVIRWIQEEAPAGSLVVFANSDIYLDDSWRALWSVNMANTFLSLLRWDDGDEGAAPTLFGPRADSQDTWAVSADSVKSRTWNWAALDIPFGKGGCDNAINVEMLRQKFLVANPALTLITHHVHRSGYRTYNPLDIIDRPMYMHVQPTGLHDLKPESTMPPPAFKVSEPARILELQGFATASQTRTFHTMAARAYKGLVADGSIAPATDVPIYDASGVFVNHVGLCSTYDSILVGPTKASKTAWGNVEMSKVSPCAAVELMYVAPLPDDVFKTPASFVHKYLGKILAMRGAPLEARGEFLAPNRPDIVDILKFFHWDTKVVPVLRRDPNTNVYAKRGLIWMPQDGVASWITAAEVNALRSALRVGWEPKPSTKPSVVCLVDGVWITEDLVKTLEREFPDDAIDVITPQTSFQDAVETLLGARAFVYKCTEAAWTLLWALPVTAVAVELQFEMAPTLESLHMAQACRVKHSAIIKARDTKPVAQDAADFVKKVVSALGGSLAASPVATPVPAASPKATDLPILYMPSPDTKGYFAHAGDSFRELARMWERHGYVRIVYQEGLCNVWLGPVGNVLLYDRPTMEWLNKSAEHEKDWVIALIGNPDPKGAVGATSWTFWPRRPELVEQLVEEGFADEPLVARARRIVFYGRSENAVQADRRSADWESVFGRVDEFVHVKGMNPYPLSQREYLERLADARFGLCLAGYGRKCHREIECMAMGCVPVVAPEVDMSSYAVPPVEGVHYLRCDKPENLQALLDSVDVAQWTRMSVAAHTWWRNNASAQGSWELTKCLAGI